MDAAVECALRTLMGVVAGSEWVNRYLGLGLGGVALGLALLITVDVTARHFFNSPIAGVLEVSKVVLAYMVFLSLAFALTQQAHIRVTLVRERVSKRAKMVLDLVSLFAGVVVTVLLLSYAWRFFWEAWVVLERMNAPVPMPLWLAKLALPLGLSLFCLQWVLYSLVTILRRQPWGT